MSQHRHFGIARHEVLNVGRRCLADYGIGRIGVDVCGEATVLRAEEQDGVGLATPQHILGLAFGDYARKGEIVIGLHPGHYLAGLRRVAVNNNRNTHVVYLHRDGESEQQEQH